MCGRVSTSDLEIIEKESILKQHEKQLDEILNDTFDIMEYV